MIARLVLALGAVMGLAACAGVLGIKPSSPVHPFEHRAHVVRGINCVECHTALPAAGDRDPVAFPSSAVCRRCHTRPHDARECSDCHGEPYVRGGAELAREHLRFEHRQHVRAVRGDCVRCHERVADPAPVALRPTMATCFGCHRHEDQWRVRDCDGCHVDLAAENAPPSSHVIHDGDWLREHGVRAAAARDLCASCHSERHCASCHGAGVPALPWKLALGEVREAGAARMGGLHRAGFKARHADEARAQPGLCTSCHTESACRACHAASHVAAGAAPRSPHPPDWLSPSRGGGQHGLQARMDPMSCASCHGGAGEQLCIGCHRVGGPGGNPHGPGFASAKDKGRDVPCRFCHGVDR